MRACFESVEGMDLDLARLARGAGKLRYAIGEGLEALAQVGGHHDLGFSSVEAYALERCERRARWVQESRGLARRLARLPALRHALGTGAVGFSMAQALAKVARPEDEAAWLAEARTRTVRQMRELVSRRREGETAPESGVEAGNAGSVQASEGGDGEGDGSDRASGTVCAIEDGEVRTLTVTVDQEDAWVLECARMIVEHLAGPTMEDTVEALLGEGTTSLLEIIGASPPGTPGGAGVALLGDEPGDTRQREWEDQRARWREEAEERCERNVLAAEPPALDGSATYFPPFAGDARAIDAELRRVAAELAVRDLEIGRLAEALWKADGWRRLGYATDVQYTRERLGTSLSWLKGKWALARRVAVLPQLDRAIRMGGLGYEAAVLVASIATPDTVEAWIERASERTVKHLREEVSAAQMLARLGATATSSGLAPAMSAVAASASGGRTSAPSPLFPPSEETMEDLAALESHIVSGVVFRDARSASRVPASQDSASQVSAGLMSASQDSASQVSAGQRERHHPEGSAAAREPSCLTQLSTAVASMLERLGHREGLALREIGAGGPARAPRPSRGDRARGRVTLRLRVSAGTQRYYRWLERLFTRHGPRCTGFLRFLCASLVETWKHSLGADVAYRDVYARDRYRCTSPVCTRRDVTPHHLKLRSAGGDDSLENVTSVCAWCHLEGIHGGRLRAAPPSSSVAWTLGRRGHEHHEHTVVHGRRRAAASPRCSLAG